MVLMVADARVVEPPTDVAVTVEVLAVPSVAPPGTATLRQKSAAAPATIDAVAVTGVVPGASKMAAGNAPPETLRVELSVLKPTVVTVTVVGGAAPERAPPVWAARQTPT